MWSAWTEKAKEALAKELPSQEIKDVESLLPMVNVVGFDEEPDEDEFLEGLTSLNKSIREAVNQDKSTGVTNSIKFLVSKRLKQNEQCFRVNLRVSNNVRMAIEKQGNRIYTYQGSKKIYDPLYIKRCFKCQSFGHISSNCQATQPVCGTCAGQHETKACEDYHKALDPPTTATLCCSNCRKAGLTTEHSAFSQECPCYQKEQKKLINATPFYQIRARSL